MRYAYPQYFESKSRFLTYGVVHKAMINAGHEIIESLKDCDAVLVSLCDMLDLKELRRIRALTDKPIIAGGHYAFNYWSTKIYCDMVWIGEVYDFADCKTLEDVADSKHCYTGDDSKQLYASQRVDWSDVPIVQISKTRAYYWAGIGCKNKCAFCFTSWTHKHQNNSDKNIASAIAACKRRKVYLMNVSNEYDSDNESRTKDMLLSDYVKTPVSGSLIRCGIEFAQEETRRTKGKPISDDDIFKSIQKSNIDKINMRLFYIAGYEPISAYDEHINKLAKMMDKARNKHLIHLSFTNLQYQNYTPLYDERLGHNPDNYIDITNTKGWYDVLRRCSTHVFVSHPSPYQHVACRMGVEGSTSREQAEFWWSMLNKKKTTPKMTAYKALMDSGVLDTPKRKLNVETGEIKVL